MQTAKTKFEHFSAWLTLVVTLYYLRKGLPKGWKTWLKGLSLKDGSKGRDSIVSTSEKEGPRGADPPSLEIFMGRHFLGLFTILSLYVFFLYSPGGSSMIDTDFYGWLRWTWTDPRPTVHLYLYDSESPFAPCICFNTWIDHLGTSRSLYEPVLKLIPYVFPFTPCSDPKTICVLFNNFCSRGKVNCTRT